MGYVLLCQLATTPMAARYIFGEHSQTLPSRSILSFFMIWNLDFFRVLYSPFCIHPDMSSIQVLALDYMIGVYPLLLIFLTYILVALHDRYSIVVRMCRPMYRVFMCVQKKWDIRGSLVQAFATFLLLSYVKILNVSFDLLFPVRLRDTKGEILNNETYLYNDAEVVYFGKEHRFFAILALSMLLVFNILPIVLLLLYPCRCFQRCLSKCGVHSQTLCTFMDAFQGCFLSQPRECRYFAGIYLCVRILVQCTFFIIIDNTSFFIIACYFILIAILLLFAKPYRNSLHNKTDVVFFVLFAVAVLLKGSKEYRSWSSLSLKLLTRGFSATVILLFFLYGGVAVIFQAVPKKIFSFVKRCCGRCSKGEERHASTPLPYRLEQETLPLLH